MSKVLLVDANALLHRAWHAIPPLTAPGGQLVNAAYGFFLTFLAALRQFEPSHVAVAFDVKGKTFRDRIFKEYKAKRVQQPDEFYNQFPIVKHLLRRLEIPIVEVKGFEADDVIGTLVAHLRGKKGAGAECQIIIATGDQDALQLVGPGVSVFTLRRGLSDTIVLDAAGVQKKYGFIPERMVDYKALRGDPSDNIPGVAGIGEKTATDLVQRFGSIEQIYHHLDKLNPTIAKKLITGKKSAQLSLKLATIARNAPINFDLEQAKLHDFNQAPVQAEFEKLGFHSLVKRLPQSNRKVSSHQQASLL